MQFLPKLLAILLMLTMGAAPSWATIANGDFSAGLAGWSTTGVVSTAPSYTYGGTGAGTIFPTVGTQVSELVNVGGVGRSTMEAALGLPNGALQTFSNSLTHPHRHWRLRNGSVMTRTITDATGYISFDWNFWRSDYPTYNDLAFFTISGPGITGTQIVLLSDVNSSAEALATTTGQGPANGTGWQNYSYTLPSSGDYTIGFGVVNARDTSVESYLYIDNVDSIVMPEPSAALTAFALLGTGLLYPLRRRRPGLP